MSVVSILPPSIVAHLDAVVAKHAERLGLKVQSQPFLGERMLFPAPDGARLELRLDMTRPHWCYVDAAERPILERSVEMLEEFAKRHGPGRVWTFAELPLVHMVNDDGELVVRHPEEDRLVVRLRRLAAHEAQMARRT